MSRGYGGSPEEISWSRSKGNIEISASTERSPLSNPLGRVQGRSPRKGEAEEPTRKRTRCACSRCRKRKIKCSGPVGGDGQPCLNCKNAGAIASCVFELAGSFRVDMGGLRCPPKNYTYDVSGGIAGTLGYSNEPHTYSLGGNILQYPAPSYQGSLRQRDIAQQAYILPYAGNQDYCDYGQQPSVYDGYSSYTAATSMLQIPSQSHVPNVSQEQLTSWNPDFHTSYNNFDGSTQSVSRSSLPHTVQRSLVATSQYPTTLADTTSSAIPSGVLTKLPQQIPLRNPASSLTVPSGTRERSHWPDDYDSHTDSNPSRRSSQGTSSTHPSSSRDSLIEQGLVSSLGAGFYPLLPTSALENPLPLAEPLQNIQQQHHSSYVQQQMADKYQYHYSAMKPPPPPAPPKSKYLAPPSTDAAIHASIGNHPFTHLPPYRPVDKCGTLQYPVHKGVRKAPSRIAVEKDSEVEQRTDD